MARLLFGTIAAAVLLAVVSVAVLWPLTPSVGDAEHRVRARLEAHGDHDPGVLPQPDRVGEAIIATEDSHFFRHHGLDALGVGRAVLAAVHGSRRDFGGATLDQQLMKELYTGNGLAAKVEQVELSFKLEARYSKSEILEMYLATAYYGHGAYGLAAAARSFFGVAPADLTWAQASLLAGLVQAPSAYDPYVHPDLARSRQRHVLGRLAAVGALSRSEADAAASTPLNLR